MTEEKKTRKKKKAAATPGTDLAVVAARLEPARSYAERMLGIAGQIQLDATMERYGQTAIDMFGASTTGRQVLDQLHLNARAGLKQIEEERASVNKPLAEAKKANDALFDPTKQLLKALIDCCASRLAEAVRADAAARTQALAAVHAGARDEATLAVVHAPAEELESSTRTVWRVVVKDFAAVPDEFKCFNESLANAYARSKKGVCAIPGCEIIQEVKVGG